MPVTKYVSMNGRLRGEITAGSRTDYVTDALGSVTGTVNSSSTVVNTYRYKPYGAQLARTGTGADPRYLWTGDTGSRTTGLNRTEQYNVYRHYGVQQAQWTTVDPMWPKEAKYGYVRGRVVRCLDALGLGQPLPITSSANAVELQVITNPGVPRPLPGVAVCSVLVIGEACYEICTYRVGRPSGFWTGIGQCIADWLYDLSEEIGGTLVVPIRCARKPNRDGLGFDDEFYPRPDNPNCPYPSPAPWPNRPECWLLPPCPPKVTLDPPQKNGHPGTWADGRKGTCFGPHTHITYFLRKPPTCECIKSKRVNGYCLDGFVPDKGIF